MIFTILVIWFAIGTGSLSLESKTFNNLKFIRNRSTISCNVEVKYSVNEQGTISVDRSDIKSICQGSKFGIFKGVLDFAPEFPCTVKFLTRVKKNQPRFASKAEVSCIPPPPTGSGGPTPPSPTGDPTPPPLPGGPTPPSPPGGQSPPPLPGGPTSNCLCKFPGMRKGFPGYSRSSNIEPVMLKIKDIADTVRNDLLDNETEDFLKAFLESNWLLALNPMFENLGEDELQVDRSTNLIEYQSSRTVMQPHNSTFKNLIPKILIPTLASLLPELVTTIIDAISGNNRILDKENVARVGAFLRAVETQEIYDDDSFQILDRTFGTMNFLSPLITIALGFLIGRFLRTLLGLNRSLLLDESDHSETYHRSIAFVKAMEHSDFLDVDIRRSMKADGATCPPILGFGALLILQPLINRLITLLQEMFAQTRTLYPQFDTENLRRLDAILNTLEKVYFPVSDKRKEAMNRAFPFPPFRPRPPTGSTGGVLGIILSLLGLGGSGETLLNNIINKLLGELPFFTTPMGKKILEAVKMDIDMDEAAGQMADAIEAYLGENGTDLLAQLEASKIKIDDFISANGSALEQKGKDSMSEFAKKFMETLTKFFKGALDMDISNGFPLVCTCA